MVDDPVQFQIALDHARSSEHADQVAKDLGNVAQYAVPMLALEIALGVLLAVLAALLLRSRRGYLPDWLRPFLGVKRTLHHRSELRPKPSPLQPEGRR